MFVYNNLQIMPVIVNSDCKLKVTYYTGNKKGPPQCGKGDPKGEI